MFWVKIPLQLPKIPPILGKKSHFLATLHKALSFLPQHLNKNLATLRRRILAVFPANFGGFARQKWPNQEAFVSIALLSVWKFYFTQWDKEKPLTFCQKSMLTSNISLKLEGDSKKMRKNHLNQFWKENKGNLLTFLFLNLCHFKKRLPRPFLCA